MNRSVLHAPSEAAVLQAARPRLRNARRVSARPVTLSCPTVVAHRWSGTVSVTA